MYFYFYPRDSILQEGDSRTSKSLKAAFEDWQDAGEPAKEAKLFGNVTHRPVLNFDNDDTFVLDV